MSDIVNRLNYCTQAIDGLKEFEESPDFSEIIKIIELLNDSVKFILPNGADLIDPADFSEKHFSLLKLPFPITAFEYSCVKDDFNPNMSNTSSKRIALAWDKSINEKYFPNIYKSTPLMKQYENQDGVFVISICYIDAHSKWVVPSCLVFVPFENTEVKFNLRGTEIVKELKQEENGFKFRCEPAPILKKQFFEMQINHDIETLFGFVLADTSDELHAVLQACAVINCSNVVFEESKPPKFQNQSRLKKKKTPLFEYKILAIESERKTYTQTYSQNKNAHNSPRTHLRRGHIRRLSTGKSVWVRPALINPENGFINKEYRVTK